MYSITSPRANPAKVPRKFSGDWRVQFGESSDVQAVNNGAVPEYFRLAVARPGEGRVDYAALGMKNEALSRSSKVRSSPVSNL